MSKRSQTNRVQRNRKDLPERHPGLSGDGSFPFDATEPRNRLERRAAASARRRGKTFQPDPRKQ